MTARVFTDPPTIIGHRGLGRGTVEGHPENSVGSFRAAVGAGLGWVEMDVQRTRDDVLLVAHDPVLPDGSVLAEVTGAEAARRGLPLLEDLLRALPVGVGIVLDVKSALQDADRPATATTAALLAQACTGLTNRPLLAISFDPAAVGQMRDTCPDLAVGLLTWLRFPIGHAVAAAAHLDVEVLAVHAGSFWAGASTGRPAHLIKTAVDRLHDTGRQLLVWCPSQRRSKALAAAGVDALVVDDVPRQVKALDTLSALGMNAVGCGPAPA